MTTSVKWRKDIRRIPEYLFSTNISQRGEEWGREGGEKTNHNQIVNEILFSNSKGRHGVWSTCTNSSTLTGAAKLLCCYICEVKLRTFHKLPPLTNIKSIWKKKIQYLQKEMEKGQYTIYLHVPYYHRLKTSVSLPHFISGTVKLIKD